MVEERTEIQLNVFSEIETYQSNTNPCREYIYLHLIFISSLWLVDTRLSRSNLLAYRIPFGSLSSRFGPGYALDGS